VLRESFSLVQQPQVGRDLLIIKTLRSHSDTPHSLSRTPLQEWSARRRVLYLTTNNTHNRQTSMPPGGIRTRNPGRRVAADQRRTSRCNCIM